MSDAIPRDSTDRIMTIRVPLAFRRKAGRRLVLMPEGSAFRPGRSGVDNTMVKAIARAFRWKRLIESGQYASVLELAEAEKINQSYLCRVLRLTLLAPDIVTAILDGGQPPGLRLHDLLSPLPIEWSAQRRFLKFAT